MVFVLSAMLVLLPACSKSSRDSQAQSSAADDGTASHPPKVTSLPSGINNDSAPPLITVTPGQPGEEAVPRLEAPENSPRPADNRCVDEEKFRSALASENVENGSDDALAQRTALENAMYPLVMELVACLDVISRQLHRLMVENELPTHNGEQDIAADQAAAMRHYESLVEIRAGQSE